MSTYHSPSNRSTSGVLPNPKPLTLLLTFRDIAGAGKSRAIPGVSIVADIAKDGLDGLSPAADGGRIWSGEVAAGDILVGCAWFPVCVADRNNGERAVPNN